MPRPRGALGDAQYVCVLIMLFAFVTRWGSTRRDDLKTARVVPIVLVILLTILGATLAGCSLTGTTTTSAGESTTTTVEGEQTPADLAIAAIAKSAAITVPQTIKSGSLLAGSDAAFPPLVFARKDGYQGFDFDLCTAVAKKLGLQLEIVEVDYPNLVPGLIEDGLYDFVMAALVITPELQAQMAFTDSHLPAVLSITTPTGSPIVDAAGLSGKVTGVQKGTLAETEVAKISGVGIETYDRILDAFKEMGEGKLNAVVIERLVSGYILSSFPDFGAEFANTGSIDLGTGYGYGFKNGSEALLMAVNAAIAELRADGVYQLICEKWGVTGN